jgi:hypothetical protein
MSRWILAAALSVLVLSAQPLVTVASVSDSLSGITLIGASDPVYLPAVSALIGASALPPYEPMLPFSVLVRNDTARPLIGLCVIFDVTQFNGMKDGGMVMCSNNIPPGNSRPLLAAGVQLLASPVSQYIYIKPRHTPPAALPPERLAEYTAAKSLVISLDSVVFADGTMAGPDTRNNFVSHSAKLAADRDFSAAVLALQSSPAAQLKNYLENVASRPRAGPPSYDSEYNRTLASHARTLQRVLANHGAEDVFSAAESMAQDAATFTLHR